MESHDLALLARWQDKRDAEAFTELVHRHAGMVFATCLRVLRNGADAEDVAQECFALLAHGARGPRKHVGAWLHRVATTRALNHADSDRRRRAREHRFAEGAAPVSAAELDDLAQHVDEAINELPERLRAPLLAHFFEGKTHEAVAESLGVPRGTVTYRINRAVHVVRRSLRKRGVIVGAAAFATWMQAQAAEAAPVAVVEGLTRLAIAGGGAAQGVAATSTWLLSLKLVAVSVCAVAVLSAGGFYLAGGRAVKPGASTVTSGDGQARAVEPVLPADGRASDSPTPVPDSQGGEGVPALATSEGADGFITGRVLEASGEPVTAQWPVEDGAEPGPSTQVTLTVRKVGSHGTGIKADGSFSWKREAKWIGGKGYMIASRGDEISSPVDVAVTEQGVHGVELRLQPGARVAGVFVDREGKPIVEGDVRATLLPDYDTIGSDKTDEEGRFDVGPLPPGEYTLTAVCSGVSGGEPPRVPLRLAAGGRTTGVRLVYDAVAYAIAGRVSGPAGEVLDHVSVTLFNTPGTTALSRGGFCSDEGRFSYYVPPGEYRLLVSRHGHQAAVFDAVRPGSGELDIRLKPVQPLTGRVLGADTGAPVAGCELEATVDFEWGGQTSRSGGGWQALKEEDGTFKLDLGHTGTVKLTARAPGFEPSQVVIPDYDPLRGASGITIRLSGGVALEGHVVDADGNPVAGAYVAEDKSGSKHIGHLKHNALATTDEAGRFALSTLPREAVDLIVYCPGYPPATATAPPGHNRDKPLVIRLPRAGVIEGTVTIGNEPVARQEVYAMALPGTSGFWGGDFTATTDAQGRYRLTGLHEGTFHVNLRSGERREAEVAEGKTTTVDFALPARDASLRGRVFVAGKGRELPVRLSVLGEDVASHASFNGQTKPDGSFLFEAAPAGPAEVFASIHGDLTRTRVVRVDLKPGNANQAEIRFVEGDAVLEGVVDLGKVRMISAFGPWETAAGTEGLMFEHFGAVQGDYVYEGVPAGRGELSVTYSTEAGRYTRRFTVETASGRATRLDLAQGSSGVRVRVSGVAATWALHLVIVPADADLPNLQTLTGDDLQRLPMVFAGTCRPDLADGLAVPGLDPGEYTVLAVGWSGPPASENEPLPDLKYATATVRLEPGSMAEAEL